jgi:phage FluMu gp28-like protein
MREVPPTPSNLREQATLVIESFNDRRIQLYDCEPLRRDLHKLRVEEKSYGVRLTSPRDGDGHGDTFSAFALALLIGHEVAGDQPVAAGPFESGADPLTAWQNRLNEFAEEQRMFATPDGHDEEWRRMMVACGRAEPRMADIHRAQLDSLSTLFHL